MSLKTLKPKKIKTAPRILIYGQEGVGKSTLASGAPSPIWLDIEDGASQLCVARYEWPESTQAQSYRHVLQALKAIEEDEHGFKTLVIDTVDRLEGLIWDYVCEEESKRTGKKLTGIESFGYGKGFQFAAQEWRNLCARLDRLRTRRSMLIVLLAHSHVKMYKNPEGDDFDRYQLRLNDKSAGFLKEWADIVGFMRFEEGAAKGDNDIKSKGFSTGRRHLHFRRTAAYDAKSRFELPEQIEIKGSGSWGKLSQKKATTA